MKKNLPPDVEHRDVPRNYVDDDRTVIPVEAVEVVSWTPLLNGEGTATQVHMHVTPGEGPFDIFKFIVRLKSKAACDRIIYALQRHRDDVFGVS